MSLGSSPNRMRGLLVAGFLCVLVSAPVTAMETLDFSVTGPGADLLKDLRGASGLVAAEKQKQTDAQDIFSKARAEYAALVSALYARGYYSGVVHVWIDGREAASIPPLDAPTSIRRIQVTVDTGPVFAFSKAEVTPLAPRTELPPGFAIGKTAESDVITQAVIAGVDGWRGKGHAKAKTASQSIVADHARAALSAQVQLDPGPRLRFGALSVKGAERMRPERIRAITGLPEGALYSPEDIRRATDRLRRTGAFSSATLTEAEKITAPDLLDITATVVEAPRRHYSFGAALATNEGGTITGEWFHRNLFGGAERLTFNGAITNLGAVSGVDYKFGTAYARPATFTPDTTLGLSADIGHLDELDYIADTFSIGTSLTHVFSDSLTGSAGFAYEFSRVTDSTRTTIYRRLALPIDLTWDRRDNKTDAKRGFYIAAEAKPFLGFGISDSGARFTLDARGYKAIDAADRFVIAARLQAGAVVGASLIGTPREDLFYSGGGGTVRGQPYQSLGVNILRNSLNDPFRTGGTYFLGASLEARAKVSENIGVVGFVDVGQIGVDGFFSDFSDWHAGAGIGVRYATAVGPIRLDVAAPVGGNTGSGVQIYVGLGQAF